MKEEKFEATAIIELFGHSKIAGLVSEQTIGGATFIRVDVPETKNEKMFTRLLNPSAIYAINPVNKRIMKATAEQFTAKPIQLYEIKDELKKIKQGDDLPF